MKTFLIIGILLFVSGISLAIIGAKPDSKLNELSKKIVSPFIVIGFLLIGISSVLYLKTN